MMVKAALVMAFGQSEDQNPILALFQLYCTTCLFANEECVNIKTVINERDENVTQPCSVDICPTQTKTNPTFSQRERDLHLVQLPHQ